jgi:hypothetical protein
MTRPLLRGCVMHDAPARFGVFVSHSFNLCNVLHKKSYQGMSRSLSAVKMR